MKKIFYFTIFVLLFSTCKKDTSIPEPENFYYYLTKEQLNKTPYFTNPKFDTLTFISNKSDTLVFVKVSVDTAWYVEKERTPISSDKDFYYQQLGVKYANLRGVGKFEVLHGKYFVASNRGLYDLLKFTFNSNDFFIQDYFLGVNHKAIIDSVQIKNKVYYQVSEIFKNWQDSTTAKAYININYGLFQIEDLRNNTTWTLAN